MSDACLLAVIRHDLSKPPAYAYLPFRLPKQKEPAIGGLISSVEINCEFLTTDGWQIEGEQSSFGHDGCGGREYAKHLVSTTDLLRESRGSCHSRHAFPHICCIIQVSECARLIWLPSRRPRTCRGQKLACSGCDPFPARHTTPRSSTTLRDWAHRRYRRNRSILGCSRSTLF